jgi:hypothetical protein
MFIPSMSGMIAPSGAMGSISIVNHYNISPGVSAAQMQSIVEEGGKRTEANIYQNLATGRWPKAK